MIYFISYLDSSGFYYSLIYQTLTESSKSPASIAESNKQLFGVEPRSGSGLQISDWLLLLKQIYICIIHAFIFTLLVSSNINIDTILLNCTATVLSNIDLSIDYNFGTIWNLRRIYSNRMICCSCYTWCCNAVCPWATTNAAWTIMCNLKCS